MIVTIPIFTIAMALGSGCGYLYLSGLNLLWRSRAAAYSGTGSAADGRTEYRTVLSTHAVSDCRTGRTAQRATEYCAAIYRIGAASSRK